MGRKWLVAYDFSEQSERALRVAAEQLATEGGQIHLVHVHRLAGTSLGAEFSAYSPSLREVGLSITEQASKRLDEVAKRYAQDFESIAFHCTVVPGDPADYIAQFADEEQVDRVVVGSHGRRGLKRLFLGSVAERIVREVGCTVTVVKEVD